MIQIIQKLIVHKKIRVKKKVTIIIIQKIRLKRIKILWHKEVKIIEMTDNYSNHTNETSGYSENDVVVDVENSCNKRYSN